MSSARDSRSAEEWASISEAAKEKFASAPPRSLTALIKQNLQSIELRLQRGWSIAQMVAELSDLGVKTTVPVFKNTLYRARQRKSSFGTQREKRQLASPHSDGPAVQASPEAPIFKAKSESKNHF
jgi:hypothetical protein